jgi:hypothetical protein
MKNYSFYHRETGQLAGVLFSTDDDNCLAQNTPADHIAIDGHFDSLSKRFDLQTKQIVEWIPPAPSSDHVWNPETKRWQLSAAAQGKAQARQAAQARIAALEASQTTWLRKHAIGDPAAIANLREIDDEIAVLEAQL